MMAQVDLSDEIVGIQIAIQQCEERHQIDLRPRLVTWAIAALERDGFSRERLDRLMGDRAVKAQWLTLRQLLKPSRLRQLNQKIQGYLKQLEDEAQGSKPKDGV